jgi:hypothetical protein
VISTVARVLPVEGLPELTADYLFDACVFATCGARVDYLYHEADNELDRLLALPYTNNLSWKDRKGVPRTMPRKFISSDSAYLIWDLLGEGPYRGERLCLGHGIDAYCLSAELVGIDSTGITARQALRSKLEAAACARWPRRERFHGSEEWLAGRHGFAIPPDAPGARILLWRLMSMLERRFHSQTLTYPDVIFMSAEVEDKIRWLAPNFLGH